MVLARLGPTPGSRNPQPSSARKRIETAKEWLIGFAWVYKSWFFLLLPWLAIEAKLSSRAATTNIDLARRPCAAVAIQQGARCKNASA